MRFIGREPGQTTSLILAIGVHLAFFFFLYFGISWKPKVQEPVMAELWAELPPVRRTEKVEPPTPAPAPKTVEKPAPPPPPPPPARAKVVEPPKVSKADIELKEKQRKQQEDKLKETKAAEETKRKQALEQKEQERKKLEEDKRKKDEAQKEADKRKREEQARQDEVRKQEDAKRKEEARKEEELRHEQELKLEREAETRRAAILEEQQKLAAKEREKAEADARRRAEAEKVAARERELKGWQEKIQQRIRSKVMLPAGVPDSAQAEYVITIIPGGEVLNVKLRKSSGHPAYDAAVERAIHAASPLPVPSDPSMFQQLRELNLLFRPN